MSFTEEQLKKGYMFLEKHDLDDIIYKFKIPDKWHEIKSIECLDEFKLYTQYTRILEFDKKIISDNNEQLNMTTELMNDVFKNCTCATMARYIYIN